MAELAIEVVHQDWRDIQGPQADKGRSPKGSRRLRRRKRHLRVIPDEHRALFKRNGGQKKKEGSRFYALEGERRSEMPRPLDAHAEYIREVSVTSEAGAASPQIHVGHLVRRVFD